MRIAIEHATRLDYSAEVVENVMEARLGPLDRTHQRWSKFELRCEPTASVRDYTDGFGNQAHLITLARSHQHLEVVMRAEVETLLADPFAVPAELPSLSPSDRIDYLAASELAEWQPEIEAMAGPLRPANPDETFDAVRGLMGVVHASFTYTPDRTTVATTVSDVLLARVGVCQDFAHVLIALCRAIDVPARYVSGYIVVERPGSAEANRGGGASHAWVEAFTPTHGWRGFDPTNNLVASEHHVAIAIGRDYRDVPPTRGAYRGGADETLAVTVTTRRLE